ncbi:MAG: hypothetical protein Edafosvirus8_15 [Edafosvirus sp.]|uniref:Uncharacterized protein n=1 Tax=Edafosvirus sp. TaxID=2487765 RepID=A0A3G4ZTP4_9VIRU|nr:MAG: hypothetical protein Edafosvirus8_15 [Edafosvirus sp.]
MKGHLINDNKSFINKIESNFRNKEEIIKKKINIDENINYTFEFSRSLNNDAIIDIYLNNKHILKILYEIIGIYNLQNSVWYWSWNSSLIERDLMKKTKKIKKFGKYIKNNLNEFDPKEAEEIYYYVSNGNFFINQENVLKIIQLSLYLSDSIWFLSKKDNDESPQKIEYYFIKKIIQLQ